MQLIKYIIPFLFSATAYSQGMYKYSRAFHEKFVENGTSFTANDFKEYRIKLSAHLDSLKTPQDVDAYVIKLLVDGSYAAYNSKNQKNQEQINNLWSRVSKTLEETTNTFPTQTLSDLAADADYVTYIGFMQYMVENYPRTEKSDYFVPAMRMSCDALLPLRRDDILDSCLNSLKKSMGAGRVEQWNYFHDITFVKRYMQDYSTFPKAEELIKKLKPKLEKPTAQYADLLTREAILNIAKGDFKEAEKTIELLEKHPLIPDIRRIKVMLMSESKDTKKAILAFNAITIPKDAEKGNLYSYYHLCVNTFVEADPKRARDCALEQLKTSSNNPIQQIQPYLVSILISLNLSEPINHEEASKKFNYFQKTLKALNITSPELNLLVNIGSKLSENTSDAEKAKELEPLVAEFKKIETPTSYVLQLIEKRMNKLKMNVKR